MSSPDNKAHSVGHERHAALQELRNERYEWAKEVDPEAVAAFNEKANAELENAENVRYS